LDAGEGIQYLDKFIKDDRPIHIYLSHFHLDHIIGFHIQPKFHLKNPITIFGQPSTKKFLKKIVASPFTASFSILKKRFGLNILIKELKEGTYKIDNYSVICKPLVHADSCFGYRFIFKDENKTKILAYCTDTGPTKNLDLLAKKADVLITECSLLPKDKIDPFWPHLNPQTAAAIAKKQKVKNLFLFHFASHKYPTNKSRSLAQKAAKKIFPNTFSSYDLLEFEF
jgi:ribonuclease BN (tRNA processing enzyme)